MRNGFILLGLFLIILAGCKKDDEADAAQSSQIITEDTSEITGRLSINTYYLDSASGTEKEAYNAEVYLYASYDDITTDRQNNAHNLALFHLTTSSSSNEADFGYVNYGNYYIWAYATIHRTYYEQIAIVQVRPQQEESINVVMHEN